MTKTPQTPAPWSPHGRDPRDSLRDRAAKALDETHKDVPTVVLCDRYYAMKGETERRLFATQADAKRVADLKAEMMRRGLIKQGD